MQTSIDLIVSQIIELSLDQGSNDPVRNIHSITIEIDSRIESIMRDLREQERQCATAQA